MYSRQELVALPRLQVSNVERIPEEVGQAGDADLAPLPIPEAEIVEKRGELSEGVVPGRVPGEGQPDERGLVRIEFLRPALAPVQVADRRAVRSEALFQASANPTLRFLAEIPDEVCRDDCLDVRREPAAPRAHVQVVACEVNRDPRVDEFSELGPVLQVLGAPVDFLDDEAIRLLFSEKSENLAPDRPAAPGRGLHLLMPAGDEQVLSGGKPRDHVPLGKE